MTKRWKRTSDRGSGPANLLLDRWEVIGQQRYWCILDRETELRNPAYGCYYPSMKVARKEAERLAELAGVE